MTEIKKKEKVEVDPSTARKRRKEILASTRHTSNKKLKTEDESISAEENVSCQEATSQITSKPKTKYQNRYEPPTSMTKEQAAEWRREARRKRNRESAAASRNKVRNRISELEGEVEEWKQKYEFLLSKIDALEKNHVNGNLLHGVSGDGHAHGKVSPCSTPASATLDIIDAIQVPMNLSVPSFEASSLPFEPSEAATSNTDLTVNENSEPLTDKIDEAAEAAVDILSLPLKDALEPNEFHVIEMNNSRPA